MTNKPVTTFSLAGDTAERNRFRSMVFADGNAAASSGLPVAVSVQTAEVTLPLVAMISPSQPLSLMSLLPDRLIAAGAKTGIAQSGSLPAGKGNTLGSVIVDLQIGKRDTAIAHNGRAQTGQRVIGESIPRTVMLPPALMPVPLTQNMWLVSSWTGCSSESW